MPAPARSKMLVCEQCGVPLVSVPGTDGCLNCLLSTGLDKANDTVSPDESITPFGDHYELLVRPDGSLWELGRGAMGVTYKARHVSLEAPVALKIINARLSQRPEAKERLLHELRAAAQLRHPNVASVFHFGTVNQPVRSTSDCPQESPGVGDWFYVMELIEGESLDARVQRAGPIAPQLALEIGLQISSALVAAENRGLVHGDLKPSNIMLLSDEEADCNDHLHRNDLVAWVKVIDFGLARLAEEAMEPTGGRFVGTPPFSSPEQRQGGTIDGRSDIYSLGASLYYALVGKSYRPDAGPSAFGAYRGNLPAPVLALLKSMLADKPEDRPGSALDLSIALERCLTLTRDAKTSARSRRRRWAVAAVVVIGAIATGLATHLTDSGLPVAEKSIAVLPFRNLSDDPANAFFAEGVQDDIVSRLVKIHDLKVVGRRGAPDAPARLSHDFREIAKVLGARHLLEGSLRRSGDRILLHVSLIDARDGREIWSEGYNRKLVDAINLQGELANNIASALKAQLSPAERANVRASSTHNPDAYVLYLRGRKLENSPTFQIANYEAAESLFTQAVALDPSFALAHARLASALGLLYRYRGPSRELRERAFREVEEALRLQPSLGEAHLAKALTDYRVDRKLANAFTELQIAHRLLPGDLQPEVMIALIRRRWGQWREARAALERLSVRDPLDLMCQEELGATACLVRDWTTALRHFELAARIRPLIEPLKVERAIINVWGSGDMHPLQERLAVIASYPDTEGALTWERWDAAMLARNFSAAQATINHHHPETLSSVIGAPIPTSYFQGCIALARGESDRAQQLFESARPPMEAEALAHPGDALRHARLGLLYAYMGRKADALREGARAAELVPVSADAIDGHHWQCSLALIHARVGDTDKAISMIKSLLREPGCVSPLNEACLTLSDLRLRWQWDPLRHDRRFQEILAAPEPITVY